MPSWKGPSSSLILFSLALCLAQAAAAASAYYDRPARAGNNLDLTLGELLRAPQYPGAAFKRQPEEEDVIIPVGEYLNHIFTSCYARSTSL